MCSILRFNVYIYRNKYTFLTNFYEYKKLEILFALKQLKTKRFTLLTDTHTHTYYKHIKNVLYNINCIKQVTCTCCLFALCTQIQPGLFEFSWLESSNHSQSADRIEHE